MKNVFTREEMSTFRTVAPILLTNEERRRQVGWGEEGGKGEPEKKTPTKLDTTDDVELMLAGLRTSEVEDMVTPAYMAARQTDINWSMREILVDWLVAVHTRLKMRPETLYRAVNILDRFLTCRVVSRQRLHLIGATALFLANKCDDVVQIEARDLVAISDQAFRTDELLAMEGIMANTLSFRMMTPLPTQFLSLLAERHRVAVGSDTWHRASYLLELSLQQPTAVGYEPSRLAAAALLLAQRTTPGLPDPLHILNETQVRDAFGYYAVELVACMMRLLEYVKKSQSPPRSNSLLLTVHRKYTAESYGCVATKAFDLPCVTTPPSSPILTMTSMALPGFVTSSTTITY